MNNNIKIMLAVVILLPIVLVWLIGFEATAFLYIGSTAAVCFLAWKEMK